MNILHASSEVFPYSKTGGLADATAALAKAQATAGHAVTLVTPLYRGIREKFDGLKPLGRARMPAKVWRLEPSPNLTVLFIDEPEWFDRDGPYGHADDAERFIFFSKCVAHLARQAEIVHAHDWQGGLVMPLLADETIGKVFTIHNAAYQGRLLPSSGCEVRRPCHHREPALRPRIIIGGIRLRTRGGVSIQSRYADRRAQRRRL